MSNPKNPHKRIRKNKEIVKKSKKHDANLQKNTTIYFQLGLIVCLLMAYGLFEMTFETTIPKDYVQNIKEDAFMVSPPLIKPEEPVFEESIERKKIEQPKDYKEVPDNVTIEPLKKDFTEPQMDAPALDPDAIAPLVKKPEEMNVPIAFIEHVPIYPGCENEKTNDNKRKCMSDKIGKLIQNKFDTDIGSDYGLSGRQKIDVQFRIDKTGRVTDIKTRSPYPKLEEEAVRVISKIPTMTPGRQQNKNVGVIYALPIIFSIQD
ncbi:energy transducer TonB [Changchengzhania lutea]|uniref:energy transducer TonB n=1 Tax=Changchengzhania lutea TaxID=2049305 RepID=UPI00115DBC07|nr:energy transducer TonB [Changchengzhania lutea]